MLGTEGHSKAGKEDREGGGGGKLKQGGQGRSS